MSSIKLAQTLSTQFFESIGEIKAIRLGILESMGILGTKSRSFEEE
jgi:hypothetical protein